MYFVIYLFCIVFYIEIFVCIIKVRLQFPFFQDIKEAGVSFVSGLAVSLSFRSYTLKQYGTGELYETHRKKHM